MTSIEQRPGATAQYRRLIMNGRPHLSATVGPTDAWTVTALRQRNRAVVLKNIILSGQTTRAQIAADNGLSVASAANIVVELIQDGLVEERGNRSSRGGRPISILGPRADTAMTIGIDVGERGVAAELFDLSMTRIDREFRGGREQETPEGIAADIAAAVAALKGRHLDRWSTLIGVGLGLPGIVETDADGAQTVFAQSLGWDPVDVGRLCSLDVPVFAENGAKLQARAELWFGNARNSQHALIAMIGRGVGMGVITNGEVTAGSRSSATEWGHTMLRLDGDLCRCGNRGCVEAYLGADAILRRWKETGAADEGTGWTALGALIEASQRGEPRARGVISQVIDELGAAMGSMINLTNPDRVLIGGWVGGRLVDAFRSEIDAAIKAHALRRPAAQYEMTNTRFGGDAVAVGAGLLPLESLISSGWTIAAVD